MKTKGYIGYLSVRGASFWLLGFLLLMPACTSDRVERGEFNELSGRVTNLENIVVAEKSRAPSQLAYQEKIPQGSLSPAPSSGAPVSGSENSIYNKGQSLLKQKRYREAAEVFSRMLLDNPRGRLAPNARYWLGECHYAAGDFSGALTEFRRCLSDYPASNKAPDSLLKLSYCQSRLGDAAGAMESLRLLLANYPESPSAAMVKNGRARFSGI